MLNLPHGSSAPGPLGNATGGLCEKETKQKSKSNIFKIHSYATSDGVNREEEAVLKNAGTENEAMEVRGSYSYIGPDGVTYTIRFLANEDGFQPEGDHIPKAL